MAEVKGFDKRPSLLPNAALEREEMLPKRCIVLAWSLVLSAGCGGEYSLTVGDQVMPAVGQATVVARLRRNDFFVLDLPVKQAALRFRIAECPPRCATTDKLGYAAAQLDVPASPGRYVVTIEHQDIQGDEVAAKAPAYVWDAQKPVIAVDLDCLPRRRQRQDVASARLAINRLGGAANIIYLTRRSTGSHEQCHEDLKADGYPDGPVLLWRKQRWHIVPGRYKIPRVVVESRLMSQLKQLRREFAGLSVGICDSSLAAEAFIQAGMTAAVIGGASVKADKVKHFASWKVLAEEGLQ